MQSLSDSTAADKANHICVHNGNKVTDVVLMREDDATCIVTLSAVRRLTSDEFWGVLHDDGGALRSRVTDQAADIAMLRAEVAR